MIVEQILLSAAVGVANILGVGMLVPQALRIAQTNASDGVSGTWIGAGVAINLGWLTYGTSVGVWGLVPAAAGSFLLYAWILSLLTRINKDAARQGVALAFVLVAVLGVAFTLTNTTGLGLALSACYTVQFGPAAWAALRQPNLSGISPVTWIMAAVEAVLWTIYGVAIDDLPVALGGVGATGMSTVILVCLIARRQRRAVLPGISTSPKNNPAAPLTHENT